MIDATAIPPAVAWVVSLLVVLGAALALIGSFGLLRLPTFFERLHPPTMGTTLGAACVLGASMLQFSVLESRLVVHEVVIGVLVFVTTPVTFALLVRAALYRERPESTEASARPEASAEEARTDA